MTTTNMKTMKIEKIDYNSYYPDSEVRTDWWRCLKWLSMSFSLPKFPEITRVGPQWSWGCCFWKKEKTTGENRLFIFDHRSPGFESNNRRDIKEESLKNDAMVNTYPLECPKPNIWLQQKWKSWILKNPIPNPIIQTQK